MASLKISVVQFKEGDWWCAQCLEYDIAAQARTPDDLNYELQRILFAHIVASGEEGREPFAGLPKAPQRFWKMFEASTIYIEGEELPFRSPEHSAPNIGQVISEIKLVEPHAH